MKLPRCFVYALADPRDGKPRYVGMTSRGGERIRCHLSRARLNSPDVRARSKNWIKSLLAAGLEPQVQVLQEATTAEALPTLERAWIARGRSLGWNLVNHTDGGEGCFGRCLSEATRTKIAAAHEGKKLSAEHKAKLAAAGRLPTMIAHCREIAKANIGRSMPRDSVERGAAKRRGKTLDLETRIRFSRAHGGLPVVDHLGNVFPSASEAARALGADVSHVAKVLRQQRGSAAGRAFAYVRDGLIVLPPPPADPVLRGEKNKSAKLNAVSVLRIREMRTEGIPFARIAQAFSVSKTLVRKIVAGEAWEASGACP